MGRYGTQDGPAHSDHEEQNIDSNAMEPRRLSEEEDSANDLAKWALQGKVAWTLMDRHCGYSVLPHIDLTCEAAEATCT